MEQTILHLPEACEALLIDRLNEVFGGWGWSLSEVGDRLIGENIRSGDRLQVTCWLDGELLFCWVGEA
jgi:hypothetical protein